MGREVRLVPKNWEHPREHLGNYRPLRSGPFSERLAEWEEEKAQWDKGLIKDWSNDGYKPKTQDAIDCKSFEEWYGRKPVRDDFMPEWPASEKTHIQMYEDTSEGTPISPVMETPEKLARWLSDNNASAFGNETASYEAWLSTIKRGYAFSGMTIGGHLMSGVEANLRMDKPLT